MKPIFWIIPLAAMTAMGGCVVINGKTETRDLDHTGFNSIDASSGINVVVSQGPFAVKTEAPEGKLDRIIVKQDGATLRLSRESDIGWFWGVNGRYLVRVSAPALVSIAASGGADVDGGALQGDSLTLSASGGGDVRLDGLAIGALSASASGGGDIDAAGTCTSATITTSGGGDFNGDRLTCATVTASASSGGDIEVGATTTANGAASGGGDVHFIGSPTNVTKDESSGGDVSVDAR